MSQATYQFSDSDEDIDVYADYDPTAADEVILKILKREGRASPRLIRYILEDAAEERDIEPDEIRKQYINTSLRDLSNAGWIRKRVRGLYDFHKDPRDDAEVPDVEIDPTPMIPDRDNDHTN